MTTSLPSICAIDTLEAMPPLDGLAHRPPAAHCVVSALCAAGGNCQSGVPTGAPPVVASNAKSRPFDVPINSLPLETTGDAVKLPPSGELKLQIVTRFLTAYGSP